jgi:ubiquinone/menaquinone biosynthesis C-methylase UbiE
MEPAEVQEVKRHVTSGFNQVADDYDSPSLRALALSANRLVELAGLSAGQTVLDVGTGTGNAALAAARVVGPEGRVVGVEIAENMRARALEKIAAAGLNNVEIREGDATALPFAGPDFDAVLCASVIYTLPDIPAALQEWRRVLKPGGRMAFSSHGEGNAKLYYDLLRKYGIQLPPEMPLQRVDTPEKCADFLRRTGFEDVTVHTEQLGYRLENIEQRWDFIWKTGARIPLQYLPPPVIEQFKAEYLASVAAAAPAEGIWIDWPGIFALGRKPQS